jgi:hypothetical protein
VTSPLPPTEPVAMAEVLRAVIVVLVSLGWITLDNNTVNIIASALGVVLSWALTLLARSKVTPIAKTGSVT